MVISNNLGISRMGPNRELKKAVESYWKGEINESALREEAKKIRLANWQLHKQNGIDLIPSNDFSFYDQVLDMTATVGAIPARYNFKGGNVDLKTYFQMARGAQDKAAGINVAAMEMTKWFDTNYHYTVPELSSDTAFKLSSTKIFDEFEEAKSAGVNTKPAIIGPVTYLLVGKMKDGKSALSLLPKLLPVYEEILSKLAASGAEWIQIDEPFLSLDLTAEQKAAFKPAFEKLSKAAGNAKLLVATYFEDVKDNLDTIFSLPVAAAHFDLVRGPNQLDKILEKAPANFKVSLGVIDGRNIWKTDLAKAIEKIERAVAKLGKDRVIVSPSCSLLHVPYNLEAEVKMNAEIKNWLAFAKQKLEELNTLKSAINEGKDKVKKQLDENAAAVKSRSSSERIHDKVVKARVEAINDALLNRKSDFKTRKGLQDESLGLPLLPTTTIGSFPQTAEVRAKRAEFKAGKINDQQYNEFLKTETEKTVRFQEKIGIDVLVHGEFERNDMVEYFGEQLKGFVFSQNGWVQSYGSRCVKPPIIFGDVSRPTPMTVEWSAFAQKLTKKVMKGMLTGPVTILQWSFVRDDQSRETTCKQIALAIRDEVVDLEAAGIKAIQIDEPAIREGLPLHKGDWAAYLKWAVDSFRISAAGVRDETQIHTHMCYSEFNDIIKAIADMDADVISIETCRSEMELLEAFVSFRYPNEVGPGVYDIHTQRVPEQKEMETLIHKALKVIPAAQVWVNPDCGLKTRGWKEVEPALTAMVKAAENVRGELLINKKTAAN